MYEDLFEHVDWWMGNDTLRTLREELRAKAPELLAAAPAALAETLLDYRRLLFAASRGRVAGTSFGSRRGAPLRGSQSGRAAVLRAPV